MALKIMNEIISSINKMLIAIEELFDFSGKPAMPVIIQSRNVFMHYRDISGSVQSRLWYGNNNINISTTS
jgi:hypothetical protein